MRRMLIFTAMVTANVLAAERRQLMPFIEEAATKRESAYLEVRNKILEHGTNTLPVLAELAVDETLPWQQRLTARICYERIERGKEIKKLLETDWYAHPKIDPQWSIPIVGPEAHIAGLVRDEVKEVGLWYYCLEQEWKMTGEKGNLRDYAGYSFWTTACSLVVKDNPEERLWFLRVCADLMANVPPAPQFSPTRIRWIYLELQAEEKPDAAYVLEHRAPPPVSEEPPFRLGTNIIKRAKQP